MRRDPTFWLALAVAFVLGLLPGLGVLAYQRQVADRATADGAAQLQSKQAVWGTQRQQLEAQLASAETTVGKLQAQVASLTAQVTKLKAAPAAPTTAKPPAKAPVIVDRSVDGTTAPGQSITLTVKVKGDADKVTMRLVKIHPETGWVKTYTLEDGGISGGVHTWKKTIAAPTATGDYRFFADAYLEDTHVTMPGVSLYMFTVE